MSGQREATEALRARIAESKLGLETGEYGDIDNALGGYAVLGAAVERVLDLCDDGFDSGLPDHTKLLAVDSVRAALLGES